MSIRCVCGTQLDHRIAELMKPGDLHVCTRCGAVLEVLAPGDDELRLVDDESTLEPGLRWLIDKVRACMARLRAGRETM